MIHGLPATSDAVTVVVMSSGPGMGCASGAAPGHIGSCVCPGDGCQAGVWALRPPHANTTQSTKIKGFMTIPAIEQKLKLGPFEKRAEEAGERASLPSWSCCRGSRQTTRRRPEVKIECVAASEHRSSAFPWRNRASFAKPIGGRSVARGQYCYTVTLDIYNTR